MDSIYLAQSKSTTDLANIKGICIFVVDCMDNITPVVQLMWRHLNDLRQNQDCLSGIRRIVFFL